MKTVKAVVFCFLVAVVATFAVKNGGDVTLRYYFGLESRPIPLSLLILFSVFVGIVIAFGFSIAACSRLKREVRSRDHALQNLSRQLEVLKQSAEQNRHAEGLR